MKQFSKLLVANIFVAIILLSSCQKETKDVTISKEEATASVNSKQPLDPGFADNDMVMYWNEKTSIVAASWNPQPARARFYAITQIAVHDALNAIKPKYWN